MKECEYDISCEFDDILKELQEEDWYISMKDEMDAFIKRERYKMQKELDNIATVNLSNYQPAEKNFKESVNYVSSTLK